MARPELLSGAETPESSRYAPLRWFASARGSRFVDLDDLAVAPMDVQIADVPAVVAVVLVVLGLLADARACDERGFSTSGASGVRPLRYGSLPSGSSIGRRASACSSVIGTFVNRSRPVRHPPRTSRWVALCGTRSWASPGRNADRTDCTQPPDEYAEQSIGPSRVAVK
jgi:hypothetical protein